MKLTKTLTIFFLFLFSVFSVYGISEYTHTSDGDYISGESAFNEDVISTVTASKGIVNAFGEPIVCDIDGDSVSDFVVYSGGSFKIYEGKTLALMGTFDGFSDETSISSSVVCVDLNGDSNNDIIFHNEGQSLQTSVMGFFWNGTQTVEIFNHSINHTNSHLDLSLGCNTEYCMLGGHESAAFDGSGFQIALYSFDETSFLDTATWNDDASQSEACMPTVKSVPVVDSDNDNADEWHFGGFFGHGQENEGYWYIKASINSTGHIIKEVSMAEQDATGMTDFIGGSAAAIDCDVHKGKEKSSGVAIMDFDGDGNVLEGAISVMVSDGRIKMYKFNTFTGESNDDYPQSLLTKTVEGDVLSNIVRLRAFQDTPENDFCTMALTDEGGISFLCASTQSVDDWKIYTGSGLPAPQKGAYDNADEYIYPSYYAIHSLQSDNEVTARNQNYNEISTTYGIFKLLGEGTAGGIISGTLCSIFNACLLELIWENPQHPSATLPIDSENIGLNDMVLMKNFSIWYYDDQRSNLNCNNQNCVTSLTICPSTEGIIKANTTMEFITTVTDFDNQNLSYKVTIYEGRSFNETSGWHGNFTSGTIDSTFFTPKITTGSASWRIDIYETGDPTTIFSYDGAFAVANDGNEYGEECFDSDFDNIPDADGDGIPDPIDRVTEGQNDAITNTLDTFGGSSGLSTTVLWLFIMLIIAVAMIVGVAKSNNVTTGVWLGVMGVIIFVEFLMTMIGWKLGYIPTGYLLSIILIGVIILGFVISKMFTNNSGV